MIPTTKSNVDLSLLHPRFKKRLEAFFDDPRIRGRVSVSSGCRSYAKQTYFYKKYLSGKGNLAANPDRRFGPIGFDGQGIWLGSWHQQQLDGWCYACDFHRINNDLHTWEINSIAKEYGMHPTVDGEWWHHQPRKSTEWFEAPALKARVIKEEVKEPQIDWHAVLEYIAGLAATVSDRPLRRGSRNEAVRVLQRKLGELGLDAGTPDGIFGRMTTRAVRRYQRLHNLTVDGIVGPATWARLMRG
jgi:hypothetical protein